MRQFLKTVWGFFSEFASPSYEQQQQQTYTEANAFVLSKMRQPRDKKNSDLVILRYQCFAYFRQVVTVSIAT